MPSSGERFGRYEVLERIGRGGMAEVFHARFAPAPGVSKEVVLKRILPAYAEQPEFRKMFLAEARLTMRLSHGNVVQVFDAGEVDGALFLAMEFIDGVSLDAVMERAQKRGLVGLPPVVAALIIIEVLKGLHHAHTRTGDDGQPLNLVHRDVSPDNVLVSFDGDVKVTDFGIAKAALAGRELTRPGIFKGKFTYGAPEQARGEAVDARADLYATAIVLYELIAGKNPSGTTEVAKEVGAGMRQLPRFPVRLADPEFVNVITRALAPLPGDRYASAQHFQQALMQWAAVRAGAHAASAVANTMRWLFAEELKRRGGAGFEPVPDDFLESMGAKRSVDSEAPTQGNGLPRLDGPSQSALPTGKALVPREAPEGLTQRHVAAIGFAVSFVLLGVAVWMWAHEDPTGPTGSEALRDAMRPGPPAPPPGLPPPVAQPITAEPLDAGEWEPPPPPVFRVEGAPATFKLTESHLLFVDGAAFVDWAPGMSFKLKSLPRVPKAVGPVFAFQRAGGQGVLTRLELGELASLAAEKGSVQLFAVTTTPFVEPAAAKGAAAAKPSKAPAAPTGAPARAELSGKPLELPRGVVQYVGKDRRVTVEGLSPKRGYLLTLAPAVAGGRAPMVLALPKGESSGRGASINGSAGPAALPAGEHLVTYASELSLMVPTVTGLKRDDVQVTLVPAEGAGAAGGKSKKAAAKGTTSIVSTVSQAQPFFERAMQAIAAGSTAEARAELGKGLKADPRNAGGHYWAGVLAQRQGDTSGALFHFQLFLKLAAPDHASRGEVEGLVAALEKGR